MTDLTGKKSSGHTARQLYGEMAEYGGTILAVQDTTGVTYTTHGKTEEIGYIRDKTLGVKVHKRGCQGRVGVRIPRDSRSGIPEREAVLQIR